jgi:hypothetical protein
MRSRHHRHAERGQVLVVSALMGTLLIGATALAVDLSVQTSHRRALQNVTDVAALAGARDLYASTATSLSTQQSNAMADALATVQSDMGWPDTWLSGASTTCPNFPPATFSQYSLSGQCESITYGDYTVTVSTPPVSPRNPADLDLHDVEVDMSQVNHNGLAGVIGMGTSTNSGHSVASHYPSGTTLGFALFSNSIVEAGNYHEKVNGNVYANRAIQLQSSGSSSFCAQSTTATTGADDGYIILASPQGSGSGQQALTPRAWPYATLPNAATSCDGVTTSGVFQTGTEMQTDTCPTSIGGLTSGLTYDSTINTCETLPVTPPTAAPPPLSGNVVSVNHPCQNPNGGGGGHTGSGFPSCWGSGTTVADGLYQVSHTSSCVAPSCYDLQITATMSLGHVTVWLEPGATFDVNMGGNGGTLTVQGPYNAGTGQADDGRFVIYGQSGSQFSLHGNNVTAVFQTGSIWMPSGSVVGGSSSAELSVLAGQAVVDTWNIQTGAQSNPNIGYDGTYAAAALETLRLEE